MSALLNISQQRITWTFSDFSAGCLKQDTVFFKISTSIYKRLGKSTSMPWASQANYLVSCQIKVSLAVFCGTWVASVYSAYFSIIMLFRKFCVSYKTNMISQRHINLFLYKQKVNSSSGTKEPHVTASLCSRATAVQKDLLFFTSVSLKVLQTTMWKIILVPLYFECRGWNSDPL